MVATEYHLDRRVRSAHRFAEITRAGRRDWSNGSEPAPRPCSRRGRGRRQSRS